MAESSKFWGGEYVGDCGPYTSDDLAEFIKAICTTANGQGVITGVLEALNVTEGFSEGAFYPIVHTGMALTEGRLYHNDADIHFYGAGQGFLPAVGVWNFYTIFLSHHEDADGVHSIAVLPIAVFLPPYNPESDYPEILHPDIYPNILSGVNSYAYIPLWHYHYMVGVGGTLTDIRPYAKFAYA